jgi:hypothetical protein
MPEELGTDLALFEWCQVDAVNAAGQQPRKVWQFADVVSVTDQHIEGVESHLEYFQARTKYLQLADKAARTVMLLTERLDHHRGRGQQQITVKHVTTNNVTADQAIIADSVTTGGAARNAASPALLAAHSATPMPILNETKQSDQGGGTKSK